MNDRTEIESHTTSVIHPTPCFRSDRSPSRNERGRRQTRPRVAGGPASLAEIRCSSVALRHRLSAALLFAALRVIPSARLGARSSVVWQPAHRGCFHAVAMYRKLYGKWKWSVFHTLFNERESALHGAQVCADRLHFPRSDGRAVRTSSSARRERGAGFEPPPRMRVG
jgi:hypothetical protein